MASVKLEKIVEKMKLENLTPELDISKIKIKQPDINRPHCAGKRNPVSGRHLSGGQAGDRPQPAPGQI